MPTKIITPTELQGQAVEYFQSLKVPEGASIEVWEVDTDSGVHCGSNCHRVGYVLIGDQCYCVGHASILVTNLRGDRHVDIDVARPILVPDELSASEDLLELMRNFMYFVADNKGKAIGTFIYERATALGNRCDAAIKARTQ